MGLIALKLSVVFSISLKTWSDEAVGVIVRP